MKTLNILSLDLDWFNGILWQDVGAHIISFFARLQHGCELPSSVTLMSEHQYLYPWCSNILLGHGADRVNVVNLDAHHDFYFLEEIEDYDDHLVDCGNFFAFMAHKGILGKYTWITNADDRSRLSTCRREMDGFLDVAQSSRVRAVRKRAKVHSRQKAWEVLQGQKFDGFCIVQSSEYVENGSVVYWQINQILRDKFSILNGFSVETHRRKRNFRNSKIPTMKTSQRQGDRSSLLISA